MRRANDRELERILPYLKNNVKDCIYMYIDIAKYGVHNDFLEVWVNDGPEIDCVCMRYHTGFSVYTERENWPVDDVIRLIGEHDIRSITARRDIAEALFDKLGAGCYELVTGSVFEFVKYHPMDLDIKVERAKTEDMMACARLIAGDEAVGSYYDIDDLADQLTERMNTGMGRNFIIRSGDEIVAHIASYAEYDGIATTSGLVVDPRNRNGLLGAYLEKHLVDALLADGFRIYTFITNRLRYRMLKTMGNPCVGEYGKLTRKAEGRD